MQLRHLRLCAVILLSPLAVFSAETMRTFREWYYPYGIIMPKETTPETGVDAATEIETAPAVAAGPVDDIVQGVDDPEAPISDQMPQQTPQVPKEAELEPDDTPTQSADEAGEATK